MPNNVVNWITTRNYGFSDGADLFVFISGYTAAFVFGRMMRDHGFVIGATRLWKRVWQLYLAHVMLFVVYVAAVGYVALRFQLDNVIHEFNVAWLIEHPFVTLIYALLLGFKPVNLDVLPLYIVLMALFPFVLWIMLRRPNLTVLGSFLLYVAAPLLPAGNPPCVSGGDLVLQSVLLAVPVLLGRLVCAGRRLEVVASHRVATIRLFRLRLPGICAGHHAGRGASKASVSSFRTGSTAPSVPTTRPTWRRSGPCISA